MVWVVSLRSAITVSLPLHLDHLPIGGGPLDTINDITNDDFQSLNFGVHTAWRKKRDFWHQVVSTATLH